MNEEFFADACADVFGSNPHMFELGPLISDNQSVETNNLAFTLCHINLIVADEIGRYGEVRLANAESNARDNPNAAWHREQLPSARRLHLCASRMFKERVNESLWTLPN